MLEKFFKNPVNTGIIAVITLVVIFAWVYDSSTNPKKDFYGLLKPKATV